MEAVERRNKVERTNIPASETVIDGTEDVTSPVHPVAPFPPLLGTHTAENARVGIQSVGGGRAPEFYGFVAWLITLLVYFSYVLWAFLPDWVIRAAGITWYPAREWAVLLPAWSVILFLIAYFVYIALAIYATPVLSRMSTVTDPRAHYARNHRRADQNTGERDWYLQCADENAVPAPYDMPLALVNRVLFKDSPSAESSQISVQGA